MFVSDEKRNILVATLTTIFLSLVLIWVASNTGEWTKDSVAQYGLAKIQVGGDGLINYPDTLSKAKSGGRAVTAFIVMGSIFGVSLLALIPYGYLIDHQYSKFARNSTPMVTGVLAFFMMLPFSIWSGQSHKAIKDDAFGVDVRLGPGFTCSLFAWFFSLLAVGLAYALYKTDALDAYESGDDIVTSGPPKSAYTATAASDDPFDTDGTI